MANDATERPVVHVVDTSADGMRVDQVVGAIPEVGSRAEAQRLIEAGRVLVDGAAVAKRRAVRAGERLEIRPVARPAAVLEPERMDLDIRYEDDDLIVVDKPAGVVSHPSRGHDTGTLVHGLLGHGIAGGGDAGRPGIVHRLDRDTSGLMIVAKTEHAHRRLQRLLRDREIDRRYVALVHGHFPPALAVDLPIGRDRRNRLRMAPHGDAARDARTRFRRLAEYAHHSLVEARLETGRTHQIRVHLQAAGHPVVGDPVYGRHGDELGLHRQFLHAWHLEFPHPRTDEPVVLDSPLPADLQAVLDALPPPSGASR